MQDYLGHGHFLSQELSWDVVLRYLSLLLPNIYISLSLFAASRWHTCLLLSCRQRYSHTQNTLHFLCTQGPLTALVSAKDQHYLSLSVRPNYSCISVHPYTVGPLCTENMYSCMHVFLWCYLNEMIPYHTNFLIFLFLHQSDHPAPPPSKKRGEGG